MLQRKEDGSLQPEIKVYGFLIGVEAVEGMDPEKIAQRLMDSLTFIEGVGDVTVDVLGEIEEITDALGLETELEDWDTESD